MTTASNVFAIEGENPKIGERPKKDYKITSDFAKKLSMTGNTERHEQARQYAAKIKTLGRIL